MCKSSVWRSSTGYDSFDEFADYSDDEAAAILVHAFVTSRVDYCNMLLAEAPKSTDKL